MNFSQAIRNLKNKGFVEKKSGDHVYLWFFDSHNKKTNLRFHYSHSDKQNDKIPERYFMTSKDSLKLDSKQEVTRLFNCTMSREEYENITCR